MSSEKISPSGETRPAETIVFSYFARSSDNKDNLRDTAFAVIYVVHDEASTQAFANKFFPATLVVPVEWEYQYGTAMRKAASKNMLFQKLSNATKNAKDALSVLQEELIQRSNRTPLLLPQRNFHSKQYLQFLAQLQTDILKNGDKLSTVKDAVRCFKQLYPLRKMGSRDKPCYVDDREIEFHSPGSARHGFIRGDDKDHIDHHPSCILGGRRRLGAAFDRQFHYDCQRGAGNLQAEFFGCHTDVPSLQVGHPHLNVAPNDFVR